MAHRFSRRWSLDTSSPTNSSRLTSSRSQTSKKNLSKPPQPAAPQALSFGCLFIPDFPVWAARFHDPLLNLRPVLVHRRGKVLSASAECLAAGVQIDWLLSRAQSLCPQA